MLDGTILPLLPRVYHNKWSEATRSRCPVLPAGPSPALDFGKPQAANAASLAIVVTPDADTNTVSHKTH